MKRLFFLLAFSALFFSISSSAQTWQQSSDTLLNGVSGLNRFYKIGTTIVTNNNTQIFRITDPSQPWDVVDPGLGIPASDRDFVTSYSCGDTVFVVSFSGNIYRSADVGQTWNLIAPSGFSTVINVTTNYFFYSFGNFAFLEFPGDSTFITTNGIQWTYFCPTNEMFNITKQYVIRSPGSLAIIYDQNMNIVDTTSIQIPSPSNPSCLDATHYQYEISANDSQIYRYDFLQPALGLQLVGSINLDPQILTGSPGYYICGNFQLATCHYISPTGHGTYNYYSSSDNGQTWIIRNDLSWMGYYNPIALTMDSIIAWDFYKHGYNLSTDAGLTWHNISNVKALGYQTTNYSETHDTVLCAPFPTECPGDFPLGMIRSFDGGQTWELANSGLPIVTNSLDSTVQILLQIAGPVRSGNNYMLAYVGANVTMYYSTDAGTSWHLTNNPPGDYPMSLGTDENDFFYWGQDGTTNLLYYSRTHDNGQTWLPLNVPVGDTIGNHVYVVNSVQGRYDTLIARAEQYYYPFRYTNHRLSLSTDDGISWTDITPPSFMNGPEKISDFVNYPYKTNSLLCYTGRSDQFILVVRQVDTTQVLDPYSFPVAFADSLYYFDGTSWTVIQHSGLPSDIDIQSLTYSNGAYYIGSNYGAYKSTDNCLTWDGSSVRAASGSQQVLSNNGLTGNLQMYQMNTNGNRLQSSSTVNGIWWFDLLPLSVSNETLPTEKINIYPSPVTSGQSISWSTSLSLEKAQFSVIDATGKIILKTTISSNANYIHSFSTNGFAAGVYHIQIQNGQNKVIGKFIVK